MRVILQNAGYKPEVIITQIKSAPSGTDFDVRMGEMADMWQSGIVDALNIWQTAVKVDDGRHRSPPPVKRMHRAVSERYRLATKRDDAPTRRSHVKRGGRYLRSSLHTTV